MKRYNKTIYYSWHASRFNNVLPTWGKPTLNVNGDLQNLIRKSDQNTIEYCYCPFQRNRNIYGCRMWSRIWNGRVLSKVRIPRDRRQCGLCRIYPLHTYLMDRKTSCLKKPLSININTKKQIYQTYKSRRSLRIFMKNCNFWSEQKIRKSQA